MNEDKGKHTQQLIRKCNKGVTPENRVIFLKYSELQGLSGCQSSTTNELSTRDFDQEHNDVSRTQILPH